MATDTADLDTSDDSLAGAARRVRESGALGHSVPLLRMFDFLTEASLAGRAAKESEIAVAVFDRSNPQAVVEDATVRVYMHRLRKKLHDYHESPGAAGRGSVMIPRGEYRLVYAPPGATAEAEPSVIAPASPSGVASSRRYRRYRRFWPALALAAVAIGFVLGRGMTPGDADLARVRQEPLWADLVASNRPTSVVVGDFYMFGDKPDRGAVTRLIREAAINSPAELDRQLMANPDLIGHHVDLGRHAMPISIAPALQRILPIVSTPHADWRTPRTLAMSETSADRIKLSNIVYVGLIGDVGVMREPLLRGSAVFARLAARAAAASAGNAQASENLAYVAAFPGPNGNRIVVVAGDGDAALIQAAEIATAPEAVDRIARAAGSRDAFEALFRVAAVGTTNFGAQLVFAGRIDGARLWLNGPPKP